MAKALSKMDEPQPETLQLQKLYEDMVKARANLHEMVRVVSAKIRTPDLPMQDRADMGFLCRELETLFDESRKDAKAHKEMCSKSICMILTERSMTHPDRATDKCSGTLATGTANVKQAANLPSKGSTESNAFLRSCYVPELVIEEGVIKPDWKAVQEQVSELAAMGKKLPAGITHTFPVYEVSYRRRRPTKQLPPA